METVNFNNSIKDMICNTAIKLSDYEKLKNIVNNKKNYIQIEEMEINPFNEMALSHGIPALCILYGELNEQYPNEDWDIIGHDYMKKLGQIIQDQGFSSLSMFSGISGIGLSAVCMSKGGERYNSFISDINSVMKESIPSFINTIEQKEYASMEDYDIISGICGIANYCMLFPNEMKNELILILNYIIQLCQDKEVENSMVPGWYISSENQFLEVDKKNWPKGCFNIGLAHGIPSLLIALCNAKKLNIYVEGQNECIKKISDFLIKFRIEEEEKVYWGTHISLEEYKSETITNKNTRDAWCYGTPGVAYSLLLSGKSLKNQIYIDYAIRGMEASSERLQDIYSPTFCHGLSGIAYICHRFYEITNLDKFKTLALDLSDQILEFYSENIPFNFNNIEGDKKNRDYYDYVGMIDGVVGTLLTIISIQIGKKTPWDYAFSLSEVK